MAIFRINKSFLLVIIFGVVTFENLSIAKGQNVSLSKVYVDSAVTRIARLMEQYYVFPEIANTISRDLQSRLFKGEFYPPDSLRHLAKTLTEVLRATNQDKHLNVRLTADLPTQSPGQKGSPAPKLVEEIKIIPGNIGYWDLRGFVPLASGSRIADSCFNLLSHVDAMIIDLRKCGGGDPAMGLYMASYLLPDQTHWTNIYSRIGNTTRELWTSIPTGKQILEVPLFLLTSNRSFSAAEGFAFHLQRLKRGIVVGETSGGGAHPGSFFPVNDVLRVFIPISRAYAPDTNTNWEGVGVIPNTSTLASDALDMAISLAKQAIEKKKI